MTGEWILAIDQGTSNTKALLVDRDGRIVFRAATPLEILQPRPGFVEQDPLALWQSVKQVIAACVCHAHAERASIAGVAITNQRETAITWRKAAAGSVIAGEPVGNAITWQCRRSASVCDRLRAHATMIQSITGLPLDPLLSATKWVWLFDQHPDLQAQAAGGELHLGTVDAWLLYNLTAGKVHATDHTNASRTALLSLATLDWDLVLSDLFGIPLAALPVVCPSSGSFGTCAAIPELAGVPIVAMIGDSHAALVGHGHYQPGTVKATYGTGSSLMMLTPELVTEAKQLARTVAWSSEGGAHFALEGNIAMSGAAVQWVGEFLGLTHPVEDAAALAATVPDAAGLILVPAMVGLGAPYWDSAARGLMTNVERSHTAAHLARAAVDAIAFQVADVLEAMETAAHVTLPVLLADGGATRNDALMQMQADVLGRPVHRSTQEDLSARGAALLGGLALGWWRSLDELAALPKSVQPFEPRRSQAERERLRGAWRLAVTRARLTAERVA
ncbi:MAG: FGGY family carbohydrate kinase [Terracidiphilus sp.]|jgi:glycerol kinase